MESLYTDHLLELDHALEMVKGSVLVRAGVRFLGKKKKDNMNCFYCFFVCFFPAPYVSPVYVTN